MGVSEEPYTQRLVDHRRHHEAERNTRQTQLGVSGWTHRSPEKLNKERGRKPHRLEWTLGPSKIVEIYCGMKPSLTLAGEALTMPEGFRICTPLSEVPPVLYIENLPSLSLFCKLQNLGGQYSGRSRNMENMTDTLARSANRSTEWPPSSH